jgi:hypothetical protein
MTLEEVSPYNNKVACVTFTHTDNPGFPGCLAGRIKILDNTTLQVIGQPQKNGLHLGDGQALTLSIESITKIDDGPLFEEGVSKLLKDTRRLVSSADDPVIDYGPIKDLPFREEE